MKVKKILPNNFLNLCFSTGIIVSLYLASPPIPAQSPVTIFRESRSATKKNETTNPTEAGNVHTILMSNKEPSYAPAHLTIEIGDTVKWLNAEKSDTHSIHERTGALISPDVGAGKQWCYRFMNEGEYSYTCRFHPWMKGSITVKARDLSIRQIELPRAFTSTPSSIHAIGGELWVQAKNALWSLSDINRSGSSEALLLPIKMKLDLVSTAAVGTLCLFSERTGKFYLYNLRTHDLRPISTQRFNFTPSTQAINNSGELVFFDNTTGGFVSLNIQLGNFSLLRQTTLSSPPLKLTMAGDGRVWFIEQSRTVAGFFNIATKEIKEYPIAPGAHLSDVAASNNGSVWLTDAGRNKIIKIENGWLTEYTIPTAFSSPQGLSLDRDGRIWFTESAANKIGLLQDGHIEEYAAPPESEPASPGIDSQGNLWFIGRQSGKLGFLPAETLRRLGSSLAQPIYQPCSTTESPGLDEKTGMSR